MDTKFFTPDECGVFYIIYRLIRFLLDLLFYSEHFDYFPTSQIGGSLSRQAYLQVNFDSLPDSLGTS